MAITGYFLAGSGYQQAWTATCNLDNGLGTTSSLGTSNIFILGSQVYAVLIAAILEMALWVTPEDTNLRTNQRSLFFTTEQFIERWNWSCSYKCIIFASCQKRKKNGSFLFFQAQNSVEYRVKCRTIVNSIWLKYYLNLEYFPFIACFALVVCFSMITKSFLGKTKN